MVVLPSNTLRSQNLAQYADNIWTVWQFRDSSDFMQEVEIFMPSRENFSFRERDQSPMFQGTGLRSVLGQLATGVA